MDLHDFLDAVFYKDDKKTGERKVSCCKLVIVLVIVFLLIGMIGSGTDSDKDSDKKQSSKSVKEDDGSIDMMDTLDIEAFTEDTVVTVWNKDFLIPKGYGEDINSRVVETSSDDGLTTHHGLYMYYNGHSYISIGYISFEGVSMDDGMLSDDGVWEKIGGYEGKLAHNDDEYSFEFIEDGNSYTVYADSEADIEKVLM